MGYVVLTDPRNQVINPDISCLDLHPRLKDGLEALEHPFTFWPKRLGRWVFGLLREGWYLGRENV